MNYLQKAREIMNLAIDEGRTLTPAESAEYERFMDLHGNRGTPAGESAFKGQRFAQIVKARAIAQLDQITFAEAADNLYGKGFSAILRKAADPVVAADAGTTHASQDFVGVLRDGGSVFDSLPMRRAVVGVPVNKQTVKATAAWVGEGSAISASKWALNQVMLSAHKVAGIVPISIEALRDSSVAADREIMTDLANGVIEVVDATLLSTDAGSSVKPAGLRNSAPAITASGTAASDLISDLKGLVGTFDNRLQGKIELLMPPDLARDIASIRSTLDVAVFPGIGLTGGVLEGLPVRTSSAVPSGVIIAVIPSEFFRIAQPPQIDISKEATVAGTSLWEAGLIGFRAIRSVNWTARRTDTDLVAYIHGASYSGSGTATD